MDHQPAIHAEILKLARLLGCDPERLSYLSQMPLKDVRTLRDQVTETLFAAHEAVLRRLAAASRVLPIGLVASLAEHTLGPMVAARVAGLLDPERADQVGARLPTPFVADIAIELDPRRASDVIARSPPERIFEITGELARRGEHVTMGRFVGHLDDDALASALRALGDEDVLRTLAVLEEPLDLGRLERLTDDERLARLSMLPGSPIAAR